MTRRLQLAVCAYHNDEATIVSEATFALGADITLGSGGASVTIPGWSGASKLLISGDGFLHLTAGMRVNMCLDHGAERIVGTYEELLASGVTMPIPILLRRMNIRVKEGISIFAKYDD